ncbi:hypothetical protein [Paenibacillus bouchesdurhonensis]|uniref:hypothetical protein n=1 Tax=Paenibacillus bouchesdurhonensis TaxID=1870990 RepID=UPI000DA63101|nr:hypothetical protein [Paenibacillus bouchesdurhonensis]
MKKTKINRKWLVLPLCAGLVASLITPGSIGFAEEFVGKMNEVMFGLPSRDHMIQVPDQEPHLQFELNHDLEPFTGFHTEEQVVFENEEIQPEVNPAVARTLTVDVEKKDLFQLTEEQMEELVTGGYSIEDVYQLDHLANKLIIEPMELAERRDASGLDWNELEVQVTRENQLKQLSQLSEEHPQAYAQLSRETLEDEEQLIILIAFDMGKGTIAELIKAYQTGGEQAVANYQPQPNAKMQTQSVKSNNSNSSVDADVLKSIRSIAEETGISESELIQQYHAAKEASKHALAEKE